jgi:hypothetical protein
MPLTKKVSMSLVRHMSDLPDKSVGEGLLVEIFGKEGQAPKDKNTQIKFQDDQFLRARHLTRIPSDKSHEPDPKILMLVRQIPELMLTGGVSRRLNRLRRRVFGESHG